MSDLVRKAATVSLCGLYRYRLDRFWGAAPALPFVMLNPSTADAEIDDPTIRRCMGFARREGAGGVIVCNLYAFRATRPDDLWRAADPCGPDNEKALSGLASWASYAGMPIVCAWGTHGGKNNRPIALMLDAGAKLLCLGLTKGGHPRHPLYVRGDEPLVSYR